MAGLLVAQQRAGAAQLEVAHRDLEAGAQLRVVRQRGEPVGRLLRQRPGAGIEQVGVGALARAPDAPADLVELAEAEPVGAVDDQRVGLRDVDARLDDRGRDEHVGVAAQEADHALLELLLVHLPVRDGEAQLRAQRAQPLRGLVDVLDAVVQEERLPAARVLALERVLDEVLVVLADVGLDRAAALGRRLDHGDVAQPGEAHLQRARDRRRAHRDHVDLELELAQQLLLLDAEALLLVDDDQAEVLRAHVAAEHAVGADQDVDLAVGEALDGRALLGRRGGSATRARS